MPPDSPHGTYNTDTENTESTECTESAIVFASVSPVRRPAGLSVGSVSRFHARITTWFEFAPATSASPAAVGDVGPKGPPAFGLVSPAVEDNGR